MVAKQLGSKNNGQYDILKELLSHSQHDLLVRYFTIVVASIAIFMGITVLDTIVTTMIPASATAVMSIEILQ